MERGVARNSSPEDSAHRGHDGHARTPRGQARKAWAEAVPLAVFLNDVGCAGKT